MASYKHHNYRKIPFSTETRHADFYTYANVKNLAEECELSKLDTIKCRTIGVLQSQHGKFWLADLDAEDIQSEFRLRVSMVYMKTPPASTLRPYPVQVFGTAQWKKEPVIFVKVMQVLSIPMAIRVRDIMNAITDSHLADSNLEATEEKLTQEN